VVNFSVNRSRNGLLPVAVQGGPFGLTAPVVSSYHAPAAFNGGCTGFAYSNGTVNGYAVAPRPPLVTTNFAACNGAPLPLAPGGFAPPAAYESRFSGSLSPALELQELRHQVRVLAERLERLDGGR
jgi:hypothetical protein